jgi:NADH-quinone oxidoreductase subunit H
MNNAVVQELIRLGWDSNVAFIVSAVLGAVVLCTFLLVFIIFSIWLDRKIAGRVQDRLGPNRTGPYGLFQTFADLGKLLTKEFITPAGADKHIYNIAPILATAAILMIMAVIPFNSLWIGADLNVGVLYFVAVGSFHTIAILLAGWGSNNKYALLGAFRVIAALISYEIPMMLSLAVPVLLAGSMSMLDIVKGQSIAFIFVAPVAAFTFFVSQLAESGRSPFDLIEAESEIIAGYNIEYSGFKFAMFYAAEFMHQFVICLLMVVMFLGGHNFLNAGQPGAELTGFVVVMTKAMIVYLVVNIIRLTTPRIRIDLMMAFNWKFLVPLALANLLLVAFFGRFFVPDYGYAAELVNAGGLASFLGGIFGTGFVAELPRAIVLAAVNIALYVVANGLLHRYTKGEREKVAAGIAARRAASKLSSATAPAQSGD